MLHRLATDFVAGIRRRLKSLGLPVVRSRAASSAVQDDAGKQFLQCIQFSDHGEFDRARDCYHKVLQINPLHARAYNNLGLVYQRDGKLDEATEALKRATTIDPSLTEAYVNLGNLMQDKHELENALKYYGSSGLSVGNFRGK